MKTYREFINEIVRQSTPSLVDPQLQTQSSKPVTRPSLMQQAQDLRSMRLRAIERQGGRENEAQRLRTQLSSAQQKVSDTRAAELAKVRQGASDQTIARSQNPVRNRTNTPNTTNTSNTANNNNNNQQRRTNNKVAQVPGEPRLGRSGFRGIDNSNLRDALLNDIDRLQDVKNRWQDYNQQNPSSNQTPKPQQQQQQQPKPETNTQQPNPEGKSWWQQRWEDMFGKPEETKPETNTPQQPSNQPTQPQQPTQPSGGLTAKQQKQMDDAWKNRGTVGKQVEEYYNTLSDEDKKRFQEYSKSKGYNWQFYN